MNLVANCEFTLKSEREVAIGAPQREDTGYGKSLIVYF